MDKGGGGYDTSAMEKATNRAIDLQEKIYNEGKDLSKPWYNAGSSAVARLSDLMGLQGGSVKSRDQIYNQLLPQYAGTTTTAGATPTQRSWEDFYNKPLSDEDKQAIQTYRPDLLDDQGYQKKVGPYGTGYKVTQAKDIAGFLSSHKPAATQSTNYDALNAAVDAQLAGQQTPDDYGTLGKAFSMENYQEDPGYKFRLEQGQQALDRSLAAKGKSFTGEAAKAAIDYNSGMASQEYGNAYNRYNTDQNNLYNMLAGVSGFGQNAANSQVQQGQNYAGNVGNLTTGLANAQTAAQVAQASKPSLFSQLAGTAAQFAGSYFGAR